MSYYWDTVECGTGAVDEVHFLLHSEVDATYEIGIVVAYRKDIGKWCWRHSVTKRRADRDHNWHPTEAHNLDEARAVALAIWRMT